MTQVTFLRTFGVNGERRKDVFDVVRLDEFEGSDGKTQMWTVLGTHLEVPDSGRSSGFEYRDPKDAIKLAVGASLERAPEVGPEVPGGRYRVIERGKYGHSVIHEYEVAVTRRLEIEPVDRKAPAAEPV